MMVIDDGGSKYDVIMLMTSSIHSLVHLPVKCC